MVCRVELILDDYSMLAVARNYVRSEGSDALLGADELKGEPNCLAQQIQILLPGEPGREVLSLISPIVPAP